MIMKNSYNELPHKLPDKNDLEIINHENSKHKQFPAATDLILNPVEYPKRLKIKFSNNCDWKTNKLNVQEVLTNFINYSITPKNVNSLHKKRPLPLLSLAIMYDLDWQQIKIILDKGANPNLGEYFSLVRPLHCAVKHFFLDSEKTNPEMEIQNKIENSREIIELLLSRGANINLADRRRNTPFMKAVENCRDDAVILLADNGADIYKENYEGISPYHRALQIKINEYYPCPDPSFDYFKNRNIIQFLAAKHDKNPKFNS